MLRALTRPRHLLITGLATLVAFGALGGAVGFAQADDQVMLPASFALPAPRIGDEALYDVAWTPAGEATNASVHRVAIDAVEPFMDRHGTQHLAIVDGFARFALGSGLFLGTGDGLQQEYSEVWDSPNPIVTAETLDGYEVRSFAAYPFTDEADCLRLNAFHGTSQPLDADLTVWPACRLVHLVLPEIPLAAVAYDGTLHLEGATGDASLALWLEPGSAYPHTIEAETEDGHLRMERTDHAAGTFALPPAQVLGHAPSLRFTDPLPWGMDEAGWDHPFTPRMAYQAAMADPTWGVLREWAARHPDHQPIFLEYDEGPTQPAGHGRTWSMVLSDGRSDLDLSVRQIDRARQSTEPSLRVPETEGNAITYEIDGRSEPSRGTPLAEAWPTAASVHARWLAFAHPMMAEANLTHVEVRMNLETPWIRAGIDQYRPGAGPLTQMVTGPPDHSSHFSHLHMMFDGTAMATFTDIEEQESGRHLLGEDARGAPGPESGPREGTVTPAASVGWIVPDRSAAAGVGAAALLVGAVVWLWPLVKGLPMFGLFSRIRRPELLGHPARRRIMDAIEAEPGIHFGDLARSLDISNGSLVHHLRKLEEAGILLTRRQGGYTCHFAAGQSRASMDAACAVRSPAARQVLDAIRARPGCSAQQVCDEVGLRPATVHHHLKRLRDVGLVEAPRDGRRLRLQVTALAGQVA